MSVWTHVNGQIRLDKWDKEPKPPFLGKMAIFTVNTHGEYARKMLSECEVPCGSEGSLRWEFHQDPPSSSVCWGYISIDGDLRDYDNINEILEWLKSSTAELHIRQGILQIVIEGRGPQILSYDYKNGWNLK